MLRLLHQLELPPGWLAIFAGLAWLQARLWPMQVLGRVGDVLGTLLVAAGLAVSVWAALQVLLQRTSLFPRRTPERLVTTGLYRVSRNPIYLADAAILLGLVLIWDAIPSLVLVPLFVRLIERRFIEGEEAAIRARFGTEYDAYRARVRRWI